jgi:tetratricopeptide (TPR) repeat protein
LAKEQSGDLNGAIDAYQQCLNSGDTPLPVRLGYGRVLISAERLDEAGLIFGQILQDEPRCADAHFGRGLIFERKKVFDLAEESYSQAVRWDPAHAASWLNKGVLLGRTSRHHEAKQCLEQVTRLVPVDPVAFLNLGITQQALGLDDEALASYREALRLDPGCADAALNLGAVFQKLNDLDAAEHHYRLAASLRPEWAEPIYNLGVLAHESKEFGVATGHYDAALDLDPDHVDAHLNRALAFLTTGDYQRGWVDFEWRLKSERCSTSSMSTPPIPRWTGESLRGKRLMVICEQGFGDSLQFFRFLGMLADIGGEVSLVAPPRLNRLFTECRPAGVVRVADNFMDDWSNCDYFCFMMSLPALLGVGLAELSRVAAPYLRVPDSSARKWLSILGAGERRVGIVWRAGNKSTVKGRDMPVTAFEPLVGCEWELVSMQKDPDPAESQWLQDVACIRDVSALQEDFTDAAALIESMDLVVTVDTSVAHLSGALGKETWVVLPFTADWRWMADRDDCPWYPSVRLFRQSSPGDWTPVLQRVKEELKKRWT